MMATTASHAPAPRTLRSICQPATPQIATAPAVARDMATGAMSAIDGMRAVKVKAGGWSAVLRPGALTNYQLQGGASDRIISAVTQTLLPSVDCRPELLSPRFPLR